jgi:hypothetical protein
MVAVMATAMPDPSSRFIVPIPTLPLEIGRSARPLDDARATDTTVTAPRPARPRGRTRESESGFWAALVGGLTGGFTAFSERRR